MTATKRKLSLFLAAIALVAAPAAFASIPRSSSILEPPAIERASFALASPARPDPGEVLPLVEQLRSAADAAWPQESLPKTRVWGFGDLAPFGRQERSELSRALRQGYAEADRENAEGGGDYEIHSLYLAASEESKTKLLTGFKAAPFVEPATGLVYMRDRWYDASTGTFLTPDAYGTIDSSNLYAYCANDPVNCSDPMGTFGVNGIGPIERYVIGRLAEKYVTDPQFASDVDAFADVAVETLSNPYVHGSLQLAGGAVECSAAAGLFAVPEPTMATKVGGYALALHCADTLGAGLRTLYYGELQRTVTAQALSGSASTLGASPGTSRYVGDVGDALIGGIGTALAMRGVLGLSRATTGLGPRATKPQWLRDVEAGRNYNKARTFDYPHREVYIERPGGGYYVLDAYDPLGGEIISRKLTQFSRISETKGIEYVSELARKYPAGARIARVPSSVPLAGQRLRGQLILEVPMQTGAIPLSVRSAATARGVVIRDVFGNIY